MSKKLNLEEFFIIKTNKDISLIEYNSIVSKLKEKTNEEIIVNILITLKENQQYFTNILEKEFTSLTGYNISKIEEDKELEDRFFFIGKLYKIFCNQENLIGSITIFSSLIQALTEQNAKDYFFEEISMLSKLFERNTNGYIEMHKDIDEKHEEFVEINDTSCFLTNLSTVINKYNASNAKKIANDFLSGQTVESQMEFFKKFFHTNQNVRLLPTNDKVGYQESNQADEELYEDAEILDDDSKIDLPQKDALKDLALAIEKMHNDYGEAINLLIGTMSEMNKQFKNLSARTDSIDSSFNEYISHQTKVTNHIKEKYKLSFDK